MTLYLLQNNWDLIPGFKKIENYTRKLKEMELIRQQSTRSDSFLFIYLLF